MVVVVFRSRIRAEVDLTQLEPVGVRMYQLASNMPGFVSYKDFAAPDGEIVAIVEFETLADSTRWRDHPEHRAVQQLAKEQYFQEYKVQVCELIRESRAARP
jgi:heme-degrading monooxygenase HmoA